MQNDVVVLLSILSYDYLGNINGLQSLPLTIDPSDQNHNICLRPKELTLMMFVYHEW